MKFFSQKSLDFSLFPPHNKRAFKLRTKKISQPMKFRDIGNGKMFLGNRNIVNKSSSSKFLMQIKNCSRRDMQTVEFGIIQTLTKVSAYPRQVVG